MSQAENSENQPNTNEIEGSQQLAEDQNDSILPEEEVKQIEYTPQEKEEGKNLKEKIIERNLIFLSLGMDQRQNYVCSRSMEG